MLYVVATPIGNLEDFTFRAVRVLKEVDVIACEDTRHTRLLLQHYGIAAPMVSFHEHNESRRTPELLRRLQAGESIALVSDAGMPAVSDPGYVLIQQAVTHGVPVVPVPGPSAVTTALAVSGLPTDHFAFLGFLPRKSGERRRVLQQVAGLPWTLVVFEAPHRIIQTMEDVQAVLGSRRVAVARELTKKFEEVIRGTADAVLDRVKASPPRGEYTVVIEGSSPGGEVSAGDVTAQLQRLLASGTSSKDAVQSVAEATGVPKRAVYQAMLALRGKG